MAYFTGAATDYFSGVVMNNYYIFSNGVDKVQYWDGSASQVSILPGCENYSARTLGKFGERVVLFYTVESGTAYPQTVRWSVAGGVSTPPDADDWSETGSGYTDLESFMREDFIMNAEKLGAYYIIYGEKSIILMDYQAQVSTPFAFYARVPRQGLLARRAVVNLGNSHIFLGHDNVYSYEGGKEVIPIGNKIRDELFSIIDPTYAGSSFFSYKQEGEDVRLYIPLLGNTTPNHYFLYNLRNKSWARGGRSATGWGTYKAVDALTWDSHPSTWNQAVGRWNDVTTSDLTPALMYGNDSGEIFKDTEIVHDIAGTAIDGYHDTKDFVTGDGYRRDGTNWFCLYFEGWGDAVSLQYSVDFGATWSTATDYTLSSTWARYRYDFEAWYPQIRFRFRNNTQGETFQVRHFELGYIDTSDRGIDA